MRISDWSSDVCSSDLIRGLLLGGSEDRWSVTTEALLVAAARSDHVERLIRPALAAGKWVICDRFLDSTLAYQGGEGGLSDDVLLNLHGIASGGLRPDLTLVLQLDAEESARRAAARGGGRPARSAPDGSAATHRRHARFHAR